MRKIMAKSDLTFLKSHLTFFKFDLTFFKSDFFKYFGEFGSWTLFSYDAIVYFYKRKTSSACSDVSQQFEMDQNPKVKRSQVCK